MKTIFNKFILFGLAILPIMFQACENPNDWDVDENHKRMFSASTFSVENITATTADISWAKVPNAKFYIFEFSKDSLLFASISFTVEMNTDTLPKSGVDGYKVTFHSLPGNTGFSVRMKARGDEGIADSKYAQAYFRTKAEQLLKPVEPTDISWNAVTVNWEPGSSVTHFMVIPDGGTPQQVNITNAEKEAGKKTITGLSPETQYTIEIYNTESNRRGSRTIKTYSKIPDAERVVWLTNDDLAAVQTVMDSCTATSLTIVFPNSTQEFNSASATLTINPNLKVLNLYAMPGTQKTKYKLRNFNLPATVAIDAITFENLHLVGYDAAADYILNPSTNTGVIKEMSFKNCNLSDFRGVVRTRGALTIDNFNIDGCIVNNIKGYGLITVDSNDQPLIDNISIKNSTFSNMEVFIQHRFRNNTSINISDCTFYDMVNSGKYFVDYNGTTFGPTGTYSISNCIFSKMRYVDNAGVLTYGHGSRAAKSPVSQNNYKTFDFKFQLESWAFPADDYTGNSDALFVNPASGDFTIKDKGFAGRSTSGDPRWRN